MSCFTAFLYFGITHLAPGLRFWARKEHVLGSTPGVSDYSPPAEGAVECQASQEEVEVDSPRLLIRSCLSLAVGLL
jgi:hypothetical protein